MGVGEGQGRKGMRMIFGDGEGMWMTFGDGEEIG